MKKVTIEQLLSWAYSQELCKVGAPMADTGHGFSAAWSMMSEVAALGTLIDRNPNVYGVIPDYIAAAADPHPDAVKVGDAVRAMQEFGSFDYSGDGTWNPFPEWDDALGLIAAEVASVDETLRLKGERLNGRHVVNLVTRHAILGRGPDWTAEQPTVRMVMKSGKPAWFVAKKGRDALNKVYHYEADGFDKRKQRPMKGAYRKHELSTSIRGAILSRLDWQLWQDALHHLHSSLFGRLKSNDLLPFVPDRAPWARLAFRSTSSQAIEKG
ncbi:hypothetical protein GR248_01700 [Rhizobium leguminosarum]|uniref:hypothetical protein n=1 Tax=Rhizobium leguminosarum TaxID=384 RepID=UPI0013C6222A|nr:hypothetical protein [Rhizobium leguminosarum]NEI89522.1 hypothetical protein [Rhizobium leguminosarum]